MGLLVFFLCFGVLVCVVYGFRFVGFCVVILFFVLGCLCCFCSGLFCVGLVRWFFLFLGGGWCGWVFVLGGWLEVCLGF